MRKILLLFTILFISCLSYAQNLSLSQLLSIRKMNVGEAEEFLTQKGWKFFDAEELTGTSLGYLTFTYKLGNYDDKAESFLNFFYGKSGYDENRLSVQLLKESKYNEYVNQIKAWGGKIIKSYVEEDSFYKIYQGSTMTYVVSTGASSDGYYSKMTYYTISIFTNEDYVYTSYYEK